MQRPLKDVVLEEVYDELCDRYQYSAGCAPTSNVSSSIPRPKAAPTAQTKQTPKEKQQLDKARSQAMPKVPKRSCPTDYAEHDFAQLCARADGSTYGTAGMCRKGTPTTREETMKKIEAAGPISAANKERLSKATDEQLARIATAVNKGLSEEEGERVSAAVEKLKGEKAGGQKEGGANLQDPGEAQKYADFYANKQDLTHKAAYDTSPAVVKETLRQLKEEDPAAYKTTISALNGKGSPTKEQIAEAGWKSPTERGQAVLKSLMDNDFRDVHGTEASWRQGLQLDHRLAGSVGGRDTSDNWIWISTATNQAKGGLEAAAKGRKGSAADKEEYIRQGLIRKLQDNAAMTKEQVASAKGAGAARAQAKAQQAAALRDNLPLMTPAQRADRINNASGAEMKAILKASVGAGKNPETGRNTSYRPILSGGGGARVRKDYGTVPQMKAIARMRWDEKLSPSDLTNIGGALRASTGSTKTRSDLLNEMLGNFPRTSGLTAAERIAILDAAE